MPKFHSLSFGPSLSHSRAPAAALLIAIALAGCTDKNNNASAQQPPPPPQVNVVVLHPQSVAITAELPGRTVAALVADVRPQVSGIIRDRLFKEGGEVKAGDVLYQIDPASYQAAYDSSVAALAKAQAAVPSAQTKVDRYQGLIKQNAISKQDLDDAVATLAQAKADVAAAQAEEETAQINLQYTKISAPISGRIDASSVTPGALVTASQTTALTTIRQIDPINVDVTQSSTNLLNLEQAIKDGRIKISGSDVKVKLLLDNGSTYNQDGKLEFAEANVSETTGTFNLRAQFPNPDRLLLPGMYVKAIVEQGVAEASYLVPQRAIARNQKGEAVGTFVTQDNKVESRTLVVGQSVGNNWLVSTGIKDGDKIIVEGTQLVRAGQTVAPSEVTINESTGEVLAPKQNSSSTNTSSSNNQG